ncbi:MAG TPA: hypothetical protein VGR28_01070 [Candidatus Thermoplasmatota archaeon]|jgi:hypothetical protein|nr:hypothetical protein [Candidatus Thermoplasmatota archaeon]
MDDALPAYTLVLEAARKGARSCLACRTAFPNRLGLLKHEMAGCGKAAKAPARSS